MNVPLRAATLRAETCPPEKMLASKDGDEMHPILESMWIS